MNDSTAPDSSSDAVSDSVKVTMGMAIKVPVLPVESIQFIQHWASGGKIQTFKECYDSYSDSK